MIRLADTVSQIANDSQGTRITENARGASRLFMDRYAHENEWNSQSRGTDFEVVSIHGSKFANQNLA